MYLIFNQIVIYFAQETMIYHNLLFSSKDTRKEGKIRRIIRLLWQFYSRVYEPLDTPLIFDRFLPIWGMVKKNCVKKKQWLICQTSTIIFVTSARKASIWPTLKKFLFFFSLFHGSVDIRAELLLFTEKVSGEKKTF